MPEIDLSRRRGVLSRRLTDPVARSLRVTWTLLGVLFLATCVTLVAGGFPSTGTVPDVRVPAPESPLRSPPVVVPPPSEDLPKADVAGTVTRPRLATAPPAPHRRPARSGGHRHGRMTG